MTTSGARSPLDETQARADRSASPPRCPVVQLAKRVLVLFVLLVGAESLVSGHRVKGLREATAPRAALDAVAASWTIGSERTGL
jgi:hypothetical protein